MKNQEKSKLSINLDGFSIRLMSVISQAGLSQADFARRLGISAGFVSDAARGNKKPGADFLFSVHTIFGVSIDWLLTGEGTMHGGSGIDLELLRAIRLQIAVARAAVLDANPTAKALLLLIREGRLKDSTADPVMCEFLEHIVPTDSDIDLAAELYNGHLWTDDADTQRRNLLAAAIAHFETKKPIDKLATLVRATGSNFQINMGKIQRNAGRDYHEK